MITEKQVKDDIKAYLKARNIWYYMIVPSGYSRNGVPDFIICYKGRFIAVECKSDRPGADTTAWQEREIISIRQSGGIAVVAKAPVHLDILKEALR